MTKVAMIHYLTTPSKTLIFLAKKGLAAPLIFEAQTGVERLAVTREDLLRCAERLIVDFHGLPQGWDSGPKTDRFKELLSLPPAVNAAKRSKQVMNINLAKPTFSYDLTYWQRLSEALLPTGLREHITDCDLLCIVPHGPLHSLPFAALRWSEDEYLIERFGVCCVHSASVLRYCQSNNRKRGVGLDYKPSSCLTAAVAAIDDEDPRDFEADGDWLASLFETQAAKGPVTQLVGAKASGGKLPASKEMIQKKIAGHDVVHLACHGVFGMENDSGDPLDSGLLVSDGNSSFSLSEFQQLSPKQRAAHVLSAREVFKLELTADLVSLRACSSGRAELRSGDELIGLSNAFLYAGTPSLIVSLWNVNKRSSQQLLNEFYRLWLDRQDPIPKWQALRLAQLSLLKDPQFQHPYHWAPFILVGDWL